MLLPTQKYITLFFPLKTNKLKTGTYLRFQGCHLTLNAMGSQVPPEIVPSAKGMTFGKNHLCADRKTSF